MLESLYGDKDLIANKLKKQLKNIKVKGKQDYDIIIDLVTDVKNIVLRLQSIEAEEMLHVDNEFLGAIFRVLPTNSQVKWLDFDKSVTSVGKLVIEPGTVQKSRSMLSMHLLIIKEEIKILEIKLRKKRRRLKKSVGNVPYVRKGTPSSE